MVTFNPNAPNTIGLEWPIVTESVIPLSAPGVCAAWLVPSSTNETVTAIGLPMTWSGPSTGYGKVAIDVYDLADTGAGSVAATSRYAPNATQANNNMFAPYPWSSITTTVHTYINEEPYNDSNYVAFANTSSCRLEFGTSAFTGQVQSVTFQVRAMGYAGGSPSLGVQLYYNGAYVSTLGTLAPPADSDDIGNRFPHFQTYTFGPFATNPKTGVAWTAADVQAFDTAGSGYALGFALNSGLVGVSYVSMVVATPGVDKRKATGSSATITTLPTGTQATTTVTLASSWSKTSGTNYLLVARRLDDPAGKAPTLIPQPIYLTTPSGTTAPTTNGQLYSATIDSTGALLTTGSGDTTKTVPYVLGISGASSVDSQPYYDIEAKPVYWDVPVSQQLSGASAQAYKQIRAIVGKKASTTPTQPLCFGLRKTSTTDASEAWTGTNGNPWPAQWTSGSGTTGAAATIQSNAGQLTSGTTANGYYRQLLNVTVGPNFLSTVKVTFASVAAASSARVFFRGAATFTSGVLNSSYEVRLTGNSNLVQLYRYDGSGTPTTLKSQAFTVAAATQYTIKVLAMSQGFIGVKVWTGTEPDLWTFSYVDATNTGTGYALGALGGADTTSDTITYDDLAVYNLLSVGSLTNANLADATLSSSLGTYAFGPGSVAVYNVLFPMDNSATLAAATDYTMHVAAVQDPAASWYLLWLDATNGAFTGNQTYGGSTDAAAPGDGVTTAGADFMLSLSSSPAAPASITVTNAATTINGATLDKETIAWTNGGSLGAAFARWEIERSEDSGTTWTNVAKLSTEATLSFDDYTAKRSTAIKYRVRAVRTDGAVSDWATQTGTVTPSPIVGAKVIFTSNASPSLTVGYVPHGTDAAYEFLTAAETVVVRLHNRDYQATFRPLEQRGLRWAFTVQVWVGQSTPTGGAGVAAYTALRALAESSTVTEVCMHTGDGERFIGTIQVGKATRDVVAGIYLADVVFTQTSAAAATVVQ